jgi:K+-sensing histidine kinase KdpD
MARYGFAVAIVAVTLALVGTVDRLLGFPPLVFLVAPIAVILPLSGLRPALTALVLGAVFGDYLFVEPVRQFTFYNEGLVLTLYLSAGGLFMYLRRPSTDEDCAT